MIPIEIKKILRELFVYKNKLILVGIMGLIMAASETKYVMSLKDLVEGMENRNQAAVNQTILLILVLAILKGIARYVHLYEMNYVGELVAQNFRKKLQSKFMNLNLSFYNNFSTGSGGLISRMLNDIVIIQHGLRMFADLFREPIVMVSLIAWLFYLDWKLTLSIIIVLPLVLLLLRQMSQGIKKYSLGGQEELERITSTIKESLDGVRIIQSFNLESEMENRFKAQSSQFLDYRRRIHRLVEASGPLTEFIMTLVILGIVYYMTQVVGQEKATYGVFISYGVALLALSSPVKKLQESYVRIQEVYVASKRAFQIIDSTHEVPQSPSSKPFPKDWKEIIFDRVSLFYGTNQVLKNVSLKIGRGEVVALVGASGSGKSSLVNLLERFYDPSSGSVRIDHLPLNDIDLKDLRKNVALVSQDVFLFSDTIERNIWAGDFSKSPDRLMAAASSANAHDFILRTERGYQQEVGDRGGLLSGGEKQRVSIARALFKDSPILILDEATSALDTVSEIEVQKGLDTLMKGRTCLVIAHRLSTIQKADRIVVLRDGEIVEQGSHHDLIAKHGEYARLYVTTQSHSFSEK